MDTDGAKSINKACSFYPKDQERGSLERQKLLVNNHPTSTTHHREHCDASLPHQQRLEWGAQISTLVRL